MPGLNITRTEAKERSSHLKVLGYETLLDLTQGEETFYSKTSVTFTCNEVGYSTFIDAVAKRVISASLNNRPVDVSNYDGLTIFLNDLQESNTLVIELEAIYSKTGEGLQRSVDPADGQVYMYTQAAPALARYFLPCFDQPDLKAPFTLSVAAPGTWEVISNNPLTSKITLNEENSQWNFSPTPAISTYIYALVAGPYFHIHDHYSGKKEIPLGIYIRNSLSEFLDADNIFAETKRSFEFFEKTFDLAYPFEKYDQVAVVDYNWGAMENPGVVTFKEDRFVFRGQVTVRQRMDRASVIAHEMAHMWFGNMVTMKWWNDLWLNESFAEWSGYWAIAENSPYDNSWVSFNTEIKNWAYRVDQLTSTHPISTDAPDIDTASTNFDGISYAKGASVFKQLFHVVGRESFIKGLQNYFSKHAWGNTTLHDLLFELETASGQDLTEWKNTWLLTSGVNTLRPEVKVTDGKYAHISIQQSAPLVPSGSAELRPHKIGVGLYDITGDSLTLRKKIVVDISGSQRNLVELVGESEADLLLLNEGDMAFTKIRFDEKSMKTLKSHLGKIADPLSRSLCWSALWDMLRDAEISASTFVDIASAGLTFETDLEVITILFGQLVTVIENFAHPSNRERLRSQVAETITRLIQQVKPGSDYQLQYVRSFCSFAQSEVQQQLLQSILKNGLPGLVVDANLRWTLLLALAERGLVDQETLEAERAHDNTQDGKVAHAQCMAALNDPVSKLNAWEDMWDKNFTVSVLAGKFDGFQRPLQRDLLLPFADKFFDTVHQYWESISYEVSNRFVQKMFPRFINTPQTLHKANVWLENNQGASAGLRRFMTEGRDALVRDLNVQAADQQNK